MRIWGMLEASSPVNSMWLQHIKLTQYHSSNTKMHQTRTIPKFQDISSTHSSIPKLCFLFLWHRAIVLEVCFAPAHVLTLPSVLAAAASRNQQWRQMWKHTDTLAECDTGRNNSTPFLEPTHHHATAAPFNNSTPTFAHVATIHRHFYIRYDTQGEGREVANRNNPVLGDNSPFCQVPQITILSGSSTYPSFVREPDCSTSSQVPNLPYVSWVET